MFPANPQFFALYYVIPALFVLAFTLFCYRRATSKAAFPSCGACGYNFTGSAENRCPECGKLFIEAGILLAKPKRRTISILIALAILIPIGSLAYSVHAFKSAAVARQQAALAAAAQRSYMMALQMEMRRLALQLQKQDQIIHSRRELAPSVGNESRDNGAGAVAIPAGSASEPSRVP